MGEGLLFSVGSARWFLSFCLFLLLFARQKKIYARNRIIYQNRCKRVARAGEGEGSLAQIGYHESLMKKFRFPESRK